MTFAATAATAPADARPSVGPSGASSPRLLVLQVTEHQAAKLLRVLDTRVNCELAIRLVGQWVLTHVEPGHIARVILFQGDGRYQRWRTADHVATVIAVTDASNLLIMHPDTLVTGTTVSDSFRCLRKSVLSARTPMGMDGASIGGEAALFGSMIHDLFQNVLVLDSHTRDYSTDQQLSQAGGPDIMSFFEAVDDVLNRHSDALLAASIPVPHALKVMHKIVPRVYQWYQQVMGCGNYLNTEGVLIPASGKTLANVIVTQVHDIEELVWSPVLGLKGKIDASVHLRVNGDDKGIAVLELKSGKAAGLTAQSHSAQVSLYTLLLSERNERPVTDGFLTYIRYQRALKSVREDEAREREARNMSVLSSSAVTNSSGSSVHNSERMGAASTGGASQGANPGGRIKLGETMGKFEDDVCHRLVPIMRGELISLVMQRNNVARYLRMDCDVEDLPPVLEHQKDTCVRCFAADSCMLQHKLLEGGTEHSVAHGPGAEMFIERAGHLTADHAAYYRFWRNVLADEEEQATRNGRSIWTRPGALKEGGGEGGGRCASDLELMIDDVDDVPSHGQTQVVETQIPGTGQWTSIVADSMMTSAVDGVGGEGGGGGGYASSSPHALLPPGAHTTACFRRRRTRSDGRTLLQCGLSPGDYVIVSAEKCMTTPTVARRQQEGPGQKNDHARTNSDFELEGCATWQSALTNGFVQHVSATAISVSVDRSLAAWTTHQGLSVSDVVWRVDGEETAVSHVTAKRTLETLFMSEDVKPGMSRRRQLIVDGAAPTFRSSTEYQHQLPQTEKVTDIISATVAGREKKQVHGPVNGSARGDGTAKVKISVSSSLTTSLNAALQKRYGNESTTAVAGSNKQGNEKNINNDSDNQDIPECSQESLMHGLNDEQRRAMELSFQARDYLLILGMPGTGKTATLAAIVAAHALQGKSVLVCSHTNMAVDNLLLRLIGNGFTDIMRLGRNLNVIDQAIHDYHVSRVESRAREQQTQDETQRQDGGGRDWGSVERAIEGVRVVATTCLGIGHWVLQRRKEFDLVVVDEASQMTQPVCIGPLLFAKEAFVLVGDHYQLPPLQRAAVGTGRRLTMLDSDHHSMRGVEHISNGASAPSVGGNGNGNVGGSAHVDAQQVRDERNANHFRSSHHRLSPKYMSEESLFRRLCVRQPQAMVLLARQYRMADDIMNLCNELVYSGSLQCGDRAIGCRRLQSTWKPPSPSATAVHDQQQKQRQPQQKQPLSSSSSLSWLHQVRDPAVQVLFVDTGSSNARNTNNSDINGGGNAVDVKEGHVHNEVEARVIAQSVDFLTGDGVPAESITVLSPFRAQVDLIRKVLKRRRVDGIATQSTLMANVGNENDSHHHPAARSVVVSTIDQYQGKDNDCVFVSLVRTGHAIANEAEDGKTIGVGQLLRDWRRLNVAMTRAKTKLVFVGCARTMTKGGSNFLKHLVHYLSSCGAVVPCLQTTQHAFSRKLTD